MKLYSFPLYSFSLHLKHFLIIFSGKVATKNGQKTSRKEEKIFSFFYNFFHIFPLPLRKKTKPLTFFPLFITGFRKTARENVVLKKFFFFYMTFLDPTAPRNRKNYHLPFFFRNSDLKCPNIPLSALKFHFLQITFVPPCLRGHIYLPTHTPFFRHIMPKKRA